MFHGGGSPGGGMGRSSIDEDETKGKVYDSRVIARLPKYLGPVRRWIALGAIGMTAHSLAQMAGPFLVAQATDSFLRPGATQFGNLGWPIEPGIGLLTYVILFVGAALLMWGGQYMQTLFLAYAGQAILFRMRTQMFDHLHKLSMSFFDHNKVGRLMSRVQNDVQQLTELFTQGILELVTSVLTLVGIICIMMFMNARLALITLTVVPVLLIMMFIWQKFARRAFISVRRAIAVVNAALQEGISGVRVIQSLAREEENFSQFDMVNLAHLNANVRAIRLEALMMPAVQILSGIAFCLVLWFGGNQVLAGEMGVGYLLGFLMYIQRFFQPIMQLTRQYAQLQRAMASGARIFELLDIEPDIKDSPRAIELPPIKGEVKFNHVNFAYEPGVEVLHDINLTVNPGETTAIVGRTGSGKSSLVNLGARFYEIEQGEVTVDDYDVRSVTQQSLRRQIGIVPQDPFLFSGSIEENIRYGNMEASHEEVVEAAKTAGAHAFISRLEDGYETTVGERGGTLSAGQRQLVCLARAILANPPILILDEATSNVDTNTERIMQKSLRRLTKGRTCLIIAHRLSTVANADRIIALEQGRIVEVGTHQELLAKKGLYYQMLGAISKPDLEQHGD